MKVQSLGPRLCGDCIPALAAKRSSAILSIVTWSGRSHFGNCHAIKHARQSYWRREQRSSDVNWDWIEELNAAETNNDKWVVITELNSAISWVKAHRNLKNSECQQPKVLQNGSPCSLEGSCANHNHHIHHVLKDLNPFTIHFRRAKVHASGNGETVLTTFGPQDDPMSGRGTT